MEVQLIFRFMVCDIFFTFVGFSSEYIQFIRKIYNCFITPVSNTDNVAYTVKLVKQNNLFMIYPRLFNNEYENIEDLFNFIHSIICKIVVNHSNAQGKIALHASSLLINERLVMFAGVKGSGKTTALLYFLKNGATYVGDEIAVIDSAGVYPFLLPIRVKNKTVDYLFRNFQYTYDFLELPNGIGNKRKYLSENNGFNTRKIDEPLNCDYIFFLNRGYLSQDLVQLSNYESIIYLLNCARNNSPILKANVILDSSKCYCTNFSINLSKLSELIM